MQYRPANLLGGFYKDDSRPFSVQDTLNWIPEVASAPGTRTEAKLRTAPGLKPYVDIGQGPIRGSHNCEGKEFHVAGNKLYQISNSGVAIPIGTIPGTGRVDMSHNQITSGNELIVVNGSSGYTYNTRTQTFARINDPGYPGAISVDYLDQYLIQVEPFGRFWFHSDLANAREYNTLDRYESEASPDKIVTAKANNLEVVVFNETTIEFFDNTGAAQGTFQNKRAVIDRGCSGRWTVAKIDNSLMWLGDDGVVYRLEGYGARPVSTVPIEQAISGFNWANAVAQVYESEGHKIYYLTFPGGLTFGYDVVTQLWHRRASFGMDRWRTSTLTYVNRKWVAGDFQNGRLYTVDWAYPLESDQPLVRERTSGVQHNNQNLLTVPYLELVMGVGQKEIVPTTFPIQPPSPTISGTPPEGYQNRVYPSFTFTIGGGTGDLTVSLKGGTLPEGMTLSTAGVLSGKPKGAGSFPITVRVTDENGLWDEITVSLVISNYVMAMVSEHNVFRGVPGGLQLSLPSNLASSVASSISVNPTATLLVAGFAAAPRLRVYELNIAGTAYTEITGPTDQPDGGIVATNFSADGMWLAVSHASPDGYRVRIYEYDGETFTQTDMKTVTSDGTSVAKWSPDGNMLFWITSSITADRGGRLYKFDKETGLLGTFKTVALAASFNANNFSWSRDGKFIAVHSTSALDILGTATPEIQRVATAPAGFPDSGQGAWWSLDGEYVYAVGFAPNAENKRVGSLAWDGASLTDPQYPDFQPGFITTSGLSGGGEYLSISPSSTDPSLHLYAVNGGVLTDAATQPSTGGVVNTNANVWTPKP